MTEAAKSEAAIDTNKKTREVIDALLSAGQPFSLKVEKHEILINITEGSAPKPNQEIIFPSEKQVSTSTEPK